MRESLLLLVASPESSNSLFVNVHCLFTESSVGFCRTHCMSHLCEWMASVSAQHIRTYTDCALPMSTDFYWSLRENSAFGSFRSSDWLMNYWRSHAIPRSDSGVGLTPAQQRPYSGWCRVRAGVRARPAVRSLAANLLALLITRLTDINEWPLQWKPIVYQWHPLNISKRVHYFFITFTSH